MSHLLQREFWQKLLAPVQAGARTEGLSGRERFTLDELRNLYDVLAKNPVVHEVNRATVVETIRSIAEFMIWGDQNEPRVFEFFLENNIMAYLHRVLMQPANRTGDVAKQVLQTLSIIVQNISSETGTFFLFSNDHVNNIIEIAFDFEHEEVLGFYISLLKAISLKLSKQTSQFFLRMDDQNNITGFPLYSAAVRFAHHKEGMVRAGVRTMFLNIFSVSDPYIDSYITRPGATHYLSNVAAYLANHVQILDKRMLGAENFGPQALSSLDSQLAEVEDILSYSSDVLTTGHPYLAHLLAQQLWALVVGPLLFAPLLEQPGDPLQAAGHTNIRPACALFVLERIFQLVSYQPLINNLLLALFGRQGSVASSPLDGMSPVQGEEDGPGCSGGVEPIVSRAGSSSSSGGRGALGGEEGETYPSCRDGFVAALRRSGAHSASSALRLLVAVSRAAAAATAGGGGGGASAALLSALGLLPRGHGQLRPSGGAAAAAGCAVCELSAWLATERELLRQKLEPGGLSSSKAVAGPFTFTYSMVWSSFTLPQLPAPPEPQVEEETSPGPEAAAAGVPEPQDLIALGDEEGEELVQPVRSVGASGNGPQLLLLDDGDEDAAGPASLEPEEAVEEAEAGQPAASPQSARPQLLLAPPSPVAAAAAAAPPLAPPSPGAAAAAPPPVAPPSPVAAPAPAAAALATAGQFTAVASEGELPSPDQDKAMIDLDDDLVDGDDEDGGSSGVPSAQPTAGAPAAADTKPLESASLSPTGQQQQQQQQSVAFPPPPPPAPAPPPPAPPPPEPSHDEPGPTGQEDAEDAVPGVAGGSSSTAQLPPGAAVPPPGDAGDPGAAGSVDPGQHSTTVSKAALPEAQKAAAAPVVAGRLTRVEGDTPFSALEAAVADGPADGPASEGSRRAEAAAGAGAGAAGAEADLLDLDLDLQQSTSLSSTFNLLGLDGEAAGTAAGEQALNEPTPAAQQDEEQQEERQASAASSVAEEPAGVGSRGPSASVAGSEDGVSSVEAALAPDPAPCPLHPVPSSEPDDVVDALFSLLAAPMLPVPSLWSAAFLISQYCPRQPAGGSAAALGPAAAERQRLVQAALDEAASRVLDELSGMWCDAIFPLLCMDWGLAAEGMSRPVLRANAEVLMAGPALYPPRADGIGAGASRNSAVAVVQMMGLCPSAAAALHVYHAVQRLVAMLQLKQLVQEGHVTKQAPLPTPAHWEQRNLDLSDGQQVDLQATTAIPCIVSFTPGQERRVYFSVSGAALAQVADYAAGAASLEDPETTATVVHSSPAVVLADPAPTKLNSGIVAAASPLMGADPMVDKKVSKWVHVHVRPSVRGLLRVLRSAPNKKGGILGAMRQLADGHWVLAFPDAERSAAACRMVKQHADQLRSLYADLLGPLVSGQARA